VAKKLITLRSTIATPGAAAYAAGDELSNHATAGSVVRATFDLSGFQRGIILAAQLDVTPASGNVVTTALDVELALFKTANVPAAVGDNVTHPIAAATKALSPGVFRFDDTGWAGPLGTVAAGTSQIQKVGAHVVMPTATPTLQVGYVGHIFEFKGGEAATLTAVMRALAAWDPFGAGPAVINTFGISLDIEVE
jgi:hypothetical protein